MFRPVAKPDAAHISKTKADWWSQRHALLKQTLAETPCQLLFIGDSITHRWETDGKKIWSQYFSPYAPVNFGIGGDREMWAASGFPFSGCWEKTGRASPHPRRQMEADMALIDGK